MMKVACLQFAPKLGRVDDNMKTASRMLATQHDMGELRPPADNGVLWLVLPEMAFTGMACQTFSTFDLLILIVLRRIQL
jgi:protein N-terminal amidase